MSSLVYTEAASALEVVSPLMSPALVAAVLAASNTDTMLPPRRSMRTSLSLSTVMSTLPLVVLISAVRVMLGSGEEGWRGGG